MKLFLIKLELVFLGLFLTCTINCSAANAVDLGQPTFMQDMSLTTTSAIVGYPITLADSTNGIPNIISMYKFNLNNVDFDKLTSLSLTLYGYPNWNSTNTSTNSKLNAYHISDDWTGFNNIANVSYNVSNPIGEGKSDSGTSPKYYTFNLSLDPGTLSQDKIDKTISIAIQEMGSGRIETDFISNEMPLPVEYTPHLTATYTPEPSPFILGLMSLIGGIFGIRRKNSSKS